MNITQMVRPQSDAQPTLQSCDCDRFGPRLSGQKSNHDAVVDPDRLGDASNTPLPHRLAQIQDQKADHLDVLVVACLVGPILRAGRWGGGRVASHAPSVGRVVVVVALPHTTVGGGPYGVEYHQPSQANSPAQHDGGLR